VAEKINRLGHRTKLRKLSSGRTIGGKKFTRSYIAELLQNPIYIGKIRYRGSVYDSNIPPLIDESLFNQVQNIIRNNREPRNTPNRNKYNFLLKGLVRCSECGSIMTPTPAKSGNFYTIDVQR
jgi:site-specific DNA recombinase